MSFVVRLFGFRPTGRDDGIPFNRVRVEQSPTGLAPWTVLEVLPLDPIDANPLRPQVRNVTTDLATLTEGWYRLVFLDAADNEQPTDPVYDGPALWPSVVDVRRWAPTFNWASTGYPEPAAGDYDPLERVVRSAIAYVQQTTCRKLDATLPAHLRPLAEDAVLLRVQQAAKASSRQGIRSGLSDIKSFRAGDYQQTNRDLDEARKAGTINTWDPLNDALWALMTPECRALAEARLSGVAPGDGVVIEVEADAWDGYSYRDW